ncbi:enoyl-CoA hydratase/isomerase family protein [Pseudooceanicola atlanticus]|uniref:enoyl-CoA hydratase/isomerase family protein n=1 Tax=Pseudooceanicola atlanticus TaxID=1461694 RepID=UPI0023572F15|nr:enoyl-CoA hydratase/isomerase family protein [Pseudooceanicola atlanticus]
MSDPFFLDQTGPVARITIARPERRNALTPAELHGLADILDRLDRDEDVRVVVLTGQGERAFCAGLNLKAEEEIAAEMSGSGPTGLGAVLRRAQSMSKPLIGRINGACVAGGVGLLSACDLALAGADAVFALPEVEVGLYPFVVIEGLRGRVSDGVLAGLAGTARKVTAAEAVTLGLIAQAVPRDELDAATEQVAQRTLQIPDGQASALRTAYAPHMKDFTARIDAAETRTRAYRQAKLAQG